MWVSFVAFLSSRPHTGNVDDASSARSRRQIKQGVSFFSLAFSPVKALFQKTSLLRKQSDYTTTRALVRGNFGDAGLSLHLHHTSPPPPLPLHAVYIVRQSPAPHNVRAKHAPEADGGLDHTGSASRV